MKKIIFPVILSFISALALQYSWNTCQKEQEANADWKFITDSMDDSSFYYQKSTAHRMGKDRIDIKIKEIDKEENDIPVCTGYNCPTYQIRVSITTINCKTHQVEQQWDKYYKKSLWIVGPELGDRVWTSPTEPFKINTDTVYDNIEKEACKIK